MVQTGISLATSDSLYIPRLAALLPNTLVLFADWPLPSSRLQLGHVAAALFQEVKEASSILGALRIRDLEPVPPSIVWVLDGLHADTSSRRG